MDDDTNKPAETANVRPVASTTATVTIIKPSAPKPAARPRVTRAAVKKPVTTVARKRTPAAARAASPAAKKAVARPLAKKPAPVKKAAPARKAAPKPKSLVVQAKAGKPVKAKKDKLVRDSFTMPVTEYALIAALKKRCLNVGVAAKKSELLRAAVINLSKLSDTSVVAAVRRLDVIKTGRPGKGLK